MGEEVCQAEAEQKGSAQGRQGAGQRKPGQAMCHLVGRVGRAVGTGRDFPRRQ